MTVQDLIDLLKKQINAGQCKAESRVLFWEYDMEGPCNITKVETKDVLNVDEDSILIQDKNHFEDLVEDYLFEPGTTKEKARKRLESELTSCLIISNT